MKYYLSVDEIIKIKNLSWSEILWANKNDIIPNSCIKAFAKYKIDLGDKNPILSAICNIPDEYSENAASEALKLVAKESSQDLEEIKKKWAFLILRHIFLNRKNLADPLGLVEQVYADFDYPDFMAEFVRYMPPVGYDPRLLTDAENHDLLMSKWDSFLSKNKFFLD